jgi:hypothetical protein
MAGNSKRPKPRVSECRRTLVWGKIDLNCARSKPLSPSPFPAKRLTLYFIAIAGALAVNTFFAVVANQNADAKNY